MAASYPEVPGRCLPGNGPAPGRRLFLLCAAVAQAFAGTSASASAGAGGIIKVDTSTGLFVDSYGRARFFHGVNAVEKVAQRAKQENTDVIGE